MRSVTSALGDMPIKRKLMVITMVTSAAALICSGIGIVTVDSFLFRGYLERDLSALTRILADNTTAALAFDDPDSATKTLSALKARPHLATACIYRAEGTMFAQYSRPGDNSPCPPPGNREGSVFTDSEVFVSRPIRLEQRQIGMLVLRYDLAEIAERRLLGGLTVLGFLVASGLLAFLLSSRLQEVIVIPVSRLARAAASVTATEDYSIRAEKVAGDELGVLADAFNEMLDGIESREHDLTRALRTREQALSEARSTRDSLRTTLASIGDAVIATDVRGRIVFVNRVALALLKRRETEVIGRSFDEVFTIINEVTREPIESPLTTPQSDDTSAGSGRNRVLIAEDGSETPIDDRASPIRSDYGPVQGTVLVFRDVTSQRRAEETSRLLGSIVESSADAIIGKDLGGVVTSWNRGAERIFGYSALEMIGRPISVLAAPGRLDDMDNIMNQIRQEAKVEQYETVRQRKDGVLIHVSLTVSPVYDALGRLVGASKIARDISGRVQSSAHLALLNADLQRLNENLARSNQDLERFAFVASHDLQEPLRMIAVYSQLLVRSYPNDDSQAAMFVSNIVNGTKRMRDLLADLLAYAEIGAGLEQPLESVDLNTVLETVKQNLKVAIDDSGAVITAQKLPVLGAYGGHFVSLFQNLISNAIKYRGDLPPHIHIAAEEVQGRLCLSVKDNGIGIAPEYHEKIFAAFKRLHGNKIPGTGIGLAICQRVVERYGGRIWVESDAGMGSTFFFTIPDVSWSRSIA